MISIARPNRREKKRKLEIALQGASVHFIVNCADHYDAMELYDRATAEARAGHVDLTIITGSAKDGGDR